MKIFKNLNWQFILFILLVIVFWYSVIAIILSCSNEPVQQPKDCTCTKSYWQFLQRREYQLLRTETVECIDEITIEAAAAQQPPGSDLVSVQCE